MQVCKQSNLVSRGPIFRKAIVLCYSSQTIVHVSSQVPPIITWHICQTIVDCLSLVIIACVLNQSKDHQLLNDALNNAITMSSKLKEDVGIVQNFNQFLDDDFAIILELSLFAFNIKKEVCGVLDSFFSFLKNYEEKKPHNMLSLMLHTQFKSLCLVSSFVGREQGISIVQEYDKKFLQPMFLKCYDHLHPLENYDMESTKHRSYEDNILDIFEMIASTSELMVELVNKELLIFRRFQVDPKEIKLPLQWW